MKEHRRQSISTKLKRRQDGTQEVVVPDGFSPWKLGQRVWFQIVRGSIEITPTPRGRRGERRFSRRVRRGLRSVLKDRVT
ncbi:hypothetical protein J7U46_19245 [Pelomonas sp. V22]|uniref:hypothetical protein n=1 Tax=Pelomonas sp. V22 TaxID=2822139 RepID=UPI0024A9572E|nr:hypothetical protein [Pelomonas sp. V22]MDI4635207.1 hypothetical protein [Pelomonas sp. V22]